VIRFVPWHPAGRLPERKVAADVAPGAGVEGERALVELLAGLPAGRARWELIYEQAEAGIAARLADPRELGSAYDPAFRLGPEATWDALAAWGAGDPAFLEVIARRMPARWLLIGEDRVLVALAAVLGERALATAASAMKDAVPAHGDRMVVVAAGEGAMAALRVLADDPDLRDRMLCFVAVGGTLRGVPGTGAGVALDDWMGAHFGHDALDTEMHRSTPYAALQWFDKDTLPPGLPGVPLETMRFPEPAGQAGASAIAAIDLGVLPAVPDLPAEAVARALVAWVACDAASRRG
jgi:hypothetical protein